MNTSNPTLGAFTNLGPLGAGATSSSTMTVDGTIHKTGILAVILLLAFGFTWAGLSAHSTIPAALPIIIGAFAGLAVALIIRFNPSTAPFLSPVYSGIQGVLMAAISFPLEMMYHHIVLQAVTLTIVTLLAMLVAYRTGLIVVNNTFRAVIFGAMLSILGYYLIGMVCMFFGIVLPGLGFDGGWLSVGINLVIVIVAAMRLAINFDDIVINAGSAPKYMEWYGGFSLVVTLVWLYIELLQLLAQLRGRD